MIEHKTRSGSVRITLPVPDTASFILLLLGGTGIIFLGLVVPMRDPLDTIAKWCAWAIFMMGGVFLFCRAAYWLLGIPGVIVDYEARTLSIRPFGSTLALDQISEINVWKVENPFRRPGRIQITCLHLWRVYLGLADGQELRVWQGCSRDRARQLAQRLSDVIGKPWAGGREAKD